MSHPLDEFEYVAKDGIAYQSDFGLSRVPPAWNTAGLCHCRLRELSAEVAALRQDAARYRWLRPRLYSIDFNYADSGVSVIAFEAPKHPLGPGIALDAAIDAALPAQKD